MSQQEYEQARSMCCYLRSCFELRTDIEVTDNVQQLYGVPNLLKLYPEDFQDDLYEYLSDQYNKVEHALDQEAESCYNEVDHDAGYGRVATSSVTTAEYTRLSLKKEFLERLMQMVESV